MKPSILTFSAPGTQGPVILTGAERYKFVVDADSPKATLVALGLGAGEHVALLLLASTKDPDAAVDADFVAVKVGGTAVQLDNTTTKLTITDPGCYLLIPTATAAAVAIGLYGLQHS